MEDELNVASITIFRQLAESEVSVLDWYLHGVYPFEVMQKELSSKFHRNNFLLLMKMFISSLSLCISYSAFNSLMPGGKGMSHILKQSMNVSMCDLFVTTRQ